jgi:uncharacterized membrane protein SirB2
MITQNEKNRDMAHHIFNGSIAMVGVCLTVITLFKISGAGANTLTDEFLAVDAFIFIISTFISYLSLRKNNHKKLEWIADSLFFLGMFCMVVTGLLMVFYSW